MTSSQIEETLGDAAAAKSKETAQKKKKGDDAPNKEKNGDVKKLWQTMFQNMQHSKTRHKTFSPDMWKPAMNSIQNNPWKSTGDQMCSAHNDCAGWC